MASADIDQWTPSNAVWEALRSHTAQAIEDTLASAPLGLQLTMANAAGGGEIISAGCEQVAGVAFTAAAPHTDPDFDRYFLLFVLKGPGTTRLESWNTTQEGKAFDDVYALDPTPKVPPHASALLEPGSLVLFDGHRVHRAVVDEQEKALVNGLRQIERNRLVREESSLEAAKKSRLIRDPREADRLVTACLSLEFKRRPTRDMAESALLKHLELHAPLAYEAAMSSLQPAPSQRRRMRP